MVARSVFFSLSLSRSLSLPLYPSLFLLQTFARRSTISHAPSLLPCSSHLRLFHPALGRFHRNVSTEGEGSSSRIEKNTESLRIDYRARSNLALSSHELRETRETRTMHHCSRDLCGQWRDDASRSAANDASLRLAFHTILAKRLPPSFRPPSQRRIRALHCLIQSSGRTALAGTNFKLFNPSTDLALITVVRRAHSRRATVKSSVDRGEDRGRNKGVKIRRARSRAA